MNKLKTLYYTAAATVITSPAFAETAPTIESLAAPDTSSIESAMILAGGALIGLAVTFGGIKLVINMIRSGVTGGR